MKIKALFVASFLAMFASTAIAKPVNVQIDQLNSSSNETFLEVLKIQGNIESTTGDVASSTGEDVKILLIDADKFMEDKSIDKNNTSYIDSIIIVGKEVNVAETSTFLIGYGVDSKYLVINGLKDRAFHVVKFDGKENASITDIAKSLVVGAIQEREKDKEEV
jgi:hypothetical protein